MFAQSSVPIGDGAQKLELTIPRELKSSDFTTKFTRLIDMLGVIQNSDVPGYKKLVNQLDINRKEAVDLITQGTEKAWRNVMNNKNLKDDARSKWLSNLNITSSEATEKICDLIKESNLKARKLLDRLDTSDLIANITSMVRIAIFEQETAASEMVQMSKSVPQMINLLYGPPELLLKQVNEKLRGIK